MIIEDIEVMVEATVAIKTIIEDGETITVQVVVILYITTRRRMELKNLCLYCFLWTKRRDQYLRDFRVDICAF